MTGSLFAATGEYSPALRAQTALRGVEHRRGSKRRIINRGLELGAVLKRGAPRCCLMEFRQKRFGRARIGALIYGCLAFEVARLLRGSSNRVIAR
jgi:hypothetical protein